MDIQVEGYPRVCNSTLMGITRHELLNGTETEHSHKDIVCCSEDCKSVSVHYNVSSTGPQLNYIFIANILDYLNNSKASNVSYFSE